MRSPFILIPRRPWELGFIRTVISEGPGNLPEFALPENGRACLTCRAHALLCTPLDHFLKKVSLAQVPV